MGKFTVTKIRDTVVDYTSPFWYESALIVMKEPTSDGLLLYLGPFRQDVWFLLLLSVPITTAIIAAANYGETHMEETGNAPKLKTISGMCFWLVFGAIFQQGEKL